MSSIHCIQKEIAVQVILRVDLLLRPLHTKTIRHAGDLERAQGQLRMVQDFMQWLSQVRSEVGQRRERRQAGRRGAGGMQLATCKVL